MNRFQCFQFYQICNHILDIWTKTFFDAAVIKTVSKASCAGSCIPHNGMMEMTPDILNQNGLLFAFHQRLFDKKAQFKKAEEPKFAVICKLTPDLEPCTIIMILYHRHGNIRIILGPAF